MGELFDLIFKGPTVNLLILFYQMFLKIGLPGALGFAIIALTVTIRGLLNPFFAQQMELSHKMTKIKPHMDDLQKKHKDDKKKLQEEQMLLYKEHGINPAAGCVFAIIQIPVFIALYQVLFSFFEKGKSVSGIIDSINSAVYFPFLKISTLDPSFFGFNLAVAPNMYAKHGMHYLLLPVLTGVLQYFQVVYSTPQAPKDDKKLAVKDKDKKDDAGDMQKMMSTQMKYIFPVMIGYFSYTLPIGLSLYWNVFSLFSIIQYLRKPKS